MSFKEKEALNRGQKLGCLSYSIAGFILVVIGLVGSGVGDCLSGQDGSSCQYRKMALYPGSLILVFIGGVLLLRKFLREND